TGIVDDSGASIKERYNGSGATVMGLNIEGKAAFSRWFQIQAGATVQRSRYKEPEVWSDDESVAPVSRMFRTPNVYGYLTACFTPVKSFDIDLSGTYTGSMLVQHMAGSGTERDTAVETRDFFDLNVKLCYDIRIYKEITMEISAGVRNVFNAYQRDFDRGADRDSGYIYGPSMPRSWFAGVKFKF
ncbi:MAG: TonB-dependent receptor, partial [Alistipes sp.]|nr:TonB-dependent receptor [Alistipes sp.]